METFRLTAQERAALQNYRDARETLAALGLIRSDRSIPGDVAERVVCRALDLTPADSTVQARYDARDAAGATYQIKARTVASLQESTSFDFKAAPAGFDYLVGVLLTPACDPLAVIRVPLVDVQRHCLASADGRRFRWTPALLTADWLTVYRPAASSEPPPPERRSP